MRKILALVLALALLVGGWWYASPLLALDGLRDAAQAGDEAELEERVDFPALRESLKEQLRTALSEAARDPSGNNPLGAAGAALGLGFVDPIIDNTVTSEWVAKAVTEGQRREAEIAAAREALPERERSAVAPQEGAQQTGEKEPTAAPQGEPQYDIVREGLNSFRVRTRSAAGEPGPTLLFARDGLSWDLVGIEMPAAELLPGF